MRFYTQQHQYHCGIDLHARSMYVCIPDQSASDPSRTPWHRLAICMPQCTRAIDRNVAYRPPVPAPPRHSVGMSSAGFRAKKLNGMSSNSCQTLGMIGKSSVRGT